MLIIAAWRSFTAACSTASILNAAAGYGTIVNGGFAGAGLRSPYSQRHAGDDQRDAGAAKPTDGVNGKMEQPEVVDDCRGDDLAKHDERHCRPCPDFGAASTWMTTVSRRQRAAGDP